MLEHVQIIMQRHNNIKVTVFNGEFISDKRVNKSVTKNYELFRPIYKNGTRRALSPILASLEEFQKCDSRWTLSRILNLLT